MLQPARNRGNLRFDAVFIVYLRAIRVDLCSGNVNGIGKTHAKTELPGRIVDHTLLLKRLTNNVSIYIGWRDMRYFFDRLDDGSWKSGAGFSVSPTV